MSSFPLRTWNSIDRIWTKYEPSTLLATLWIALCTVFHRLSLKFLIFKNGTDYYISYSLDFCILCYKMGFINKEGFYSASLVLCWCLVDSKWWGIRWIHGWVHKGNGIAWPSGKEWSKRKLARDCCLLSLALWVCLLLISKPFSPGTRREFGI